MAERPVECGKCKKTARIIYKEIVGDQITITEMCPDCPVLLEKLHGTRESTPSLEQQDGEAGLFCAHCHTSLESVKMGGSMGCSECYAMFGDLLIGELIAEDKIPASAQEARRNQPLHIGKTPDKPVNVPEANKLTALNEALNDALGRENYEEAAWLRDQINELMEKKDEPTS